MLFVVGKILTGERGTWKCREEKSYLLSCSVYLLIRCPSASTGCMPANAANLKQSFPLPLILTTALRVYIQLGSGTNALALNGSRFHNDSCKDTRFERNKSEPFCSYTYMKFKSCRFTSLRGGTSAYTATISDVSVTGCCVITAGSTALWKTTSTAIWNLYALLVRKQL